MPSFSIKEALSVGWEKAKRSWGTLFVLLVAYVFVLFASQIPIGLFASLSEEGSPLSALHVLSVVFSMVVAPVLQMIIMIGFFKACFLVYDGREVTLAGILPSPQLILYYWLATMMMGMLVGFGLILLILPGIYICLRLLFYNFLLIDRSLGPIESLQESFRITRGRVWTLIVFGLALAGINLMGVLCLFVGLAITIPLSMMANIYVYRTLSGISPSPHIAAPPPPPPPLPPKELTGLEGTPYA